MSEGLQVQPSATYDIAPRPLSRLSYQIMGLNLIAVIILVAGVLYLDKYKKDLTAAETELLATEAQLYASVLSDNAITDTGIDIRKSEKIFETFGAQKIQRLRMFSPEGKLLLDTKTNDRLPQAPLSDAFPGLFGNILDVIFYSFTNILAVNFELPTYPLTQDDDMNSFPGVTDALDGNLTLSAWQSDEGGLLLATAAPVSKSGNVRAILYITRADTKIQHTFGLMRISIIQFFVGSLLITLLFSLYLSASIGHPLRKLASAAEAVRENKGGVDIIPDLSYRRDEIGELSLALREMAMTLQDRIESIEKFAADVSHELKNPLTSMRSAVETLEKVKREEDRQKLMSIIMHDLVRMDRLISDISRASRLDVELLRDVFAPVDLRQIILPLIDAYKKPFDRADRQEAPHNIVHEGLDKPVIVSGQSVRLSQVFQNLISNAMSFSPPGAIVRILVTQGNDFIKITIEDEGPGIPENRLEKIFERFYTERPQAEAFGSHSGLGLAIARQIVEAHDGSITAENISGAAGARFIVKLRKA
ncbi:MAG: histidine kinase [Micavibrio aeruginosavorus]|uniref:histidine kinase n=1 Tax=Micavibrio aeruginosavorus TaxID=349221 RepID=A0A2W5HGJ2_9BACT|nr:MAG: histidine kinase [Micavibrio aeruginosavorus]